MAFLQAPPAAQDGTPASVGAGPVVSLGGVSPGSPWGRIAAGMLAGLAELSFGGGEPPASRRWRRTVGGTALQWWSERDDRLACPAAADIHLVTDPSQAVIGRPGRTWCIVDAAGAPLFHRFHALAACHAEPHVASLHLIESRNGGASWQLLADAHLSSMRSYRKLLGVLGRTGARLLRRALVGGAAPQRDWVPGPARPGRPQALLRAQAASGLAWLRARIGGEMYGIAILEQPPGEFLRDGICPASQWMHIPASEGFVADPFFWPGQPGTILCEAYYHRTGLGELARMSVSAGRITGLEPVALGLRCHLSYPSTCLDDGHVLFLPEMAQARRQILYVLQPGAAPQPLCVVAEGVGMADPTLMRLDGRYWIAYTDTDIGTYDNLCLMHADRPEGPWHPHRANPVKIDARSSRPGGTPFSVDGQLFRPAQDCSREYGGALVINQVMRCTPEDYQEEARAVLRPDPNGPFPDGLHTFSVGDGRIVIDGKRNSYHPSILFQKIRRRVVRTPQGARPGAI